MSDWHRPQEHTQQQHHPQHEHYHPETATATATATAAAMAMAAGTAQHHQAAAAAAAASSSSVMERVLFQLHLRTCHFGLRYLSARTRRLLEHLWLAVAIAGFGALILLHRNFVFRPDGGGAGNAFAMMLVVPNQNFAATCLASIPQFDPSADMHHLSILPVFTHVTQSYVQNIVADHHHHHHHEMKSSRTCTTPSTPSEDGDEGTCSQEHNGLEDNLSPLSISYSYSLTKAYLMLPSNHSLLQHVPHIQHIVVSPHDPNCFGEPFLQLLIHNVIGYETIVWNWFVHLLYLQQTEDPSSSSLLLLGHVFSPRTGKLQELRLPISAASWDFKRSNGGDKYKKKKATTTTTTTTTLSSSWSWSSQHEEDATAGCGDGTRFSLLGELSSRFQRLLRSSRQSRTSILSKLSVVLKTTFLFFFSTTLISFTLRETQERMLEFTQELSRRVSFQLPLVDLVVFHLIHNVVFVPIMIGMMFFLIEFYSGDKLLAFLVMTIVWCVEVFSVISLRSDQGITFFPRIFFLLFCLFHIYYFANPYGFAYTALSIVGCFMGHSMAFFWHRYELPAVALGRVTIDRPRLHYQHHYDEDHDRDHGASHSVLGTSSPAWNTNTTTISRSAGAVASPLRGGANTSSTTTSTSTTHTSWASQALDTISNNYRNNGSLLAAPQSPPQIRSAQQHSHYDSAHNDPLEFQPVRSGTQHPPPSQPTFRIPTARPQSASFSSNNSSSRNSNSNSNMGMIFRRDNDHDHDHNENDHNGDDFDDDDDDDDTYGGADADDASSYVYFMQGEVVVHRGRSGGGGGGGGATTNTLTNTSGVAATALIASVESSHTLASTTSGQDPQQQHLQPQQREPRTTPESPTENHTDSSAMGLDADGMFAELFSDEHQQDQHQDNNKRPDTIIYSSPDREQRPEQQNEQPRQQEQQLYYSGDDDSKSGLQAILEVRLTPRVRNHGSGLPNGDNDDSNDNGETGTAPPTGGGGTEEAASSSLSRRTTSDQSYSRDVALRSSPPQFPELPS